jgi:hypothetical protein
VDTRQPCRCTHGQRCSCALKKEHLEPVPEAESPLHVAAVTELRKPRLTSTKSESTLTVFRDGHHKPMHKHNDMAHKCGMPYTIPRSQTLHSTSELAQRSADHLPLMYDTFDLSNKASQGATSTQRLVKSEHGSPESAPVPNLEQLGSSIPPLDLSSFQTYSSSASLESPLNAMTFQDSYEPWFASPDTEVSVNSAALNAPSVDWSSFPLSSADVSGTKTSQPPSYASLEQNNGSNGNIPNSFNYSGIATSSSGEISEVDDFGPLPSLGTSSNDLHDLHSVSDTSDVDHYRVSSASSFINLPQAQMLSSNNLESINIDDFLKSANESTAAIEQQLQATMGLEMKSIPAQHAYTVEQAQMYAHSEPTSAPAKNSPVDAPPQSTVMWPGTLFDPQQQSTAEDPFSQQAWAAS